MAGPWADSVPPTPFSLEVGARLCAVRKAKGLSLKDVVQVSDGRWSASAVGAYERGSRTLSVPKLHELAEFYDVPVKLLLGAEVRAPEPDERRLCFDLVALRGLRMDSAARLWTFVRSIAEQRGDYSGRVLTLRRADLPAVATLIGADTPAGAFELLDTWGVLANPEVGL